MKREFWAEFDLYRVVDKKGLVDYFVGRLPSPPIQELEQIQDPIARYQLLAQLAAIDEEVSFLDAKGKERSVAVKDYARTGALQYSEPSGLLFWYHASASNEHIDPRKTEGSFQGFLSDQLRRMQAVLGPTGFQTMAAQSLPDLSLFPSGAWTLGFLFTLRKPYLSKDDREFTVLDNPVRKEWVFQVPYIAPSQWKGALRAAMRRLRGYTSWEQETHDKQMVRLFGNIKGEESEFSAGWLHFYPTYFDRIGLEVINPHSRETGAGTWPIYLESVPVGTKGSFVLLYVPLGEVTEEEMRADFQAVAQGIKAMFTVYGFGAKTSSGFGRANVDWEKAEVQPRDLLWDVWKEVWQDR